MLSCKLCQCYFVCLVKGNTERLCSETSLARFSPHCRLDVPSQLNIISARVSLKEIWCCPGNKAQPDLFLKAEEIPSSLLVKQDKHSLFQQHLCLMLEKVLFLLLHGARDLHIQPETIFEHFLSDHLKFKIFAYCSLQDSLQTKQLLCLA